MSKTIYTDHDVEDMVRRGVKEIQVTENVYLTDLARERAEKLGVALRTAESPSDASPHSNASSADKEQIVRQVKADVIAKMGSQVDAAIIERIVRRVVGKLDLG